MPGLSSTNVDPSDTLTEPAETPLKVKTSKYALLAAIPGTENDNTLVLPVVCVKAL
jgi:hypothetical protein